MANADEIIVQIEGNQSKVAEAQQGAQQAGASASEFGQQMQGFGVDDKAQVAHIVSEHLNEQAVLLAQAHAKGEEAKANAARLKNNLSPGSGGASPREPAAKIGDPATAPDAAPGDLQKEHQGPEDSDRTRFQRFGRGMVRHADALEAQAKDLGSPAVNMLSQGYDPHIHSTETVETPRSAPTIGSTTHDAQVTDVVGTAVVMGAIAVEGISRWAKRKDNR
ncbi:MAG: hypothetical protein ACRDXX_09885 [Stackebrandtia sp.]